MAPILALPPARWPCPLAHSAVASGYGSSEAKSPMTRTPSPFPEAIVDWILAEVLADQDRFDLERRPRKGLFSYLGRLRPAGLVRLAMPLLGALAGAKRIAAPESHLRALAATARTASIRPCGRIRFQRWLRLHSSRAYSEPPRALFGRERQAAH